MCFWFVVAVRFEYHNLCIQQSVLNWWSLKFEHILKTLFLLPYFTLLMSYFTAFYFVYLLTNHCSYSWFYCFCLLTFILTVCGWSLPLLYCWPSVPTGDWFQNALPLVDTKIQCSSPLQLALCIRGFCICWFNHIFGLWLVESVDGEPQVQKANCIFFF